MKRDDAKARVQELELTMNRAIERYQNKVAAILDAHDKRRAEKIKQDLDI